VLSLLLKWLFLNSNLALDVAIGVNHLACEKFEITSVRVKHHHLIAAKES